MFEQCFPVHYFLILQLLGETGSHFTNGEIKKQKGQFSTEVLKWSFFVCFHRQELQHCSPPQGAPGIPTSYSAYYNISVGKAELLNKLKDQPKMAEMGEEEIDHELAQKKVKFLDIPSRFTVFSLRVSGD